MAQAEPIVSARELTRRYGEGETAVEALGRELHAHVAQRIDS
jgi:hypothetical protein